MKENEILNSNKFYGSFLDNLTKTKNNSSMSFNSYTTPIVQKYSEHYLCITCKKFPLIEFYNDYKYIKYTCSCFNNKKFLITNLIDNSLSNILLSTSMNNFDDINLNSIGIICNQHKIKFNYFCQNCNQNLCKECFENHSKVHYIINFDILKKYEDNKVKMIKENILNHEYKNNYNNNLDISNNKK